MPENITLYFTEDYKAKVTSVEVEALPLVCAGIPFHVHVWLHPLTGKPIKGERNISRNGAPLPWILKQGDDAKQFIIDRVRGTYGGQPSPYGTISINRFISDLVAWQRVYQRVSGRTDRFYDRERDYLISVVKYKGKA